MSQAISKNFDQIVSCLNAGDLVVMKSDTVYGIFAAAKSEKAIQKLHDIRQRDTKRGFIILADSLKTVADIVNLRPEVQTRLNNIWPKTPRPELGATSVILSADGAAETWLADRRDGKNTICFRVPNDEMMRKVLRATGPLAAPSANLPDQPTAQNIDQAEKYFAGQVALYVDDSKCDREAPSRIIKFRNDQTIETVRADNRPHPEDFIIARRRKQFRFANFDAYSNCFRLEEWPDKRQEILSLDRDIVIEVGAGSGEFLVKLAKRNPDKIYLAIDKKSDRLYRGARRALEEKIDNIFFIFVSADRLKNVMPTRSVSEIWLTFPDPFARETYQSCRAELTKFYHDFLRFPDDKDYAKNLKIYEKNLRNLDAETAQNFDDYLSSDSRKRLTAPHFLKLYQEILKPNGQLFFKTDNSPLFEWSLLSFSKNNWQIEFLTRDLHADQNAPAEAKIMTSYEQRFTAEGLSIKYAQFSIKKQQ